MKPKAFSSFVLKVQSLSTRTQELPLNPNDQTKRPWRNKKYRIVNLFCAGSRGHNLVKLQLSKMEHFTGIGKFSCPKKMKVFLLTGSPSSFFGERQHDIAPQRYYKSSYKIVQNKGKVRKSTYLSSCVYNLCFYGVWRSFRAISLGASFSI